MKHFLIASVLMFLIGLVTYANAESIILTWDKSETATGYILKAGSTSGIYPPETTFDIGDVDTYTIPNSDDLFYFIIIAYNQWGESLPSVEAVKCEAVGIESLIVIK